jgi:hypothetical protein
MPHESRQTSFRAHTSVLAIPSISTLPAHAADCRRVAAWLMDEFRTWECPSSSCWRSRPSVVWAETPGSRQADGALLRPLRLQRSIRSTNGSRHRSSPRNGTASSTPAVRWMTRGSLRRAQGLSGFPERRGKPPLNGIFIIEGEKSAAASFSICSAPSPAHRRGCRGGWPHMGLLRPGTARGLYRPPRHVLMPRSTCEPAAGSAFRQLRRRGSQRDGDLVRLLTDLKTRSGGSMCRSCTSPSSRPPSGAQGVESPSLRRENSSRKK